MKRLILLILLIGVVSGATWAGVRLEFDTGITSGSSKSLGASVVSAQGQTGSGFSAVFTGGEGEAVQTQSLLALLSASHIFALTMETVTFDASASLPGEGLIILYEWDTDGDGQFDESSSSATWEHTYADDGVRFIQVRITNDLGESALSEALRLTIVNQPPIAQFEVIPSSGVEGTPLQFLDLSHDEDGAISSWLWNFGDGATSSEANPTHIFDSSGHFSVMLSVIDDDGVDSGTYGLTIDILNLKPQAAFSLQQSTVNAGQPVTLVDESFDPSVEGEIVHVAWDFGDGTYQAGGPASGNVYSHVFREPGTYAITLYVIDNNGAMALAQTTVSVL